MIEALPSPDDLLDRAIGLINSETVPAIARRQAIEKAIAAQTITSKAPARRLGPFRAAMLRWAVAACLFLVIGVFLVPSLKMAREAAPPMMAEKQGIVTATPPQAGAPQDNAIEAYRRAPNIGPLVAEQAPVLVSNGPATPVPLGAELPQSQSGGAMHLWDWSKSTTSRIIPGVEIWMGDHAALSPDGEILVRADGTIIYLSPEAKDRPALPKTIDLGGAVYHEGASTYTRIGDMRFSPDGGRLALLVTLRNADRTVHDVVQVVEFPSGKRLCEFPAGEAYALRIAFSADGKQIGAGDPERRIILRDCASGQVLRRFEPLFKSQVMAIAISPDGRQIAAGSRQGGLIVWDSQNGAILWQTDAKKLTLPATADGADLLAFSPDGRHLAAACLGPLLVFDAATGKVEGQSTLHYSIAMQWSKDSASLTLVSPFGLMEPRGKPVAVKYPQVRQVDWRTGKATPLPAK